MQEEIQIAKAPFLALFIIMQILIALAIWGITSLILHLIN